MNKFKIILPALSFVMVLTVASFAGAATKVENINHKVSSKTNKIQVVSAFNNNESTVVNVRTHDNYRDYDRANKRHYNRDRDDDRRYYGRDDRRDRGYRNNGRYCNENRGGRHHRNYDR